MAARIARTVAAVMLAQAPLRVRTPASVIGTI